MRKVLLLGCVALLAGCGSGAGGESHAFAQAAKRICTQSAKAIGAPPWAHDRTKLAAWARRARAQVLEESRRLASLREPPNTHRALARLQLHERRVADALARVGSANQDLRSELAALAAARKGAVSAAHLLNVKSCMALPQVP